jgi:hypothetical protein
MAADGLLLLLLLLLLANVRPDVNSNKKKTGKL